MRPQKREKEPDASLRRLGRLRSAPVHQTDMIIYVRLQETPHRTVRALQLDFGAMPPEPGELLAIVLLPLPPANAGGSASNTGLVGRL